MALPVYAGVDRSLGSTVADGFNLQNGVCHFHQAAAACKKMALEVRPQAKTHHRQIVVIHNGPKLIHLFRLQKLTLVHNDHVTMAKLPVPEAGIHVLGRGHNLHAGLQANAASQNGFAIPHIGAGLDEPNLQVIFLSLIHI